MAPEDSPKEDIKEDTKHFINTFCTFYRASPDENQHIFDQVYEQILKAVSHGREYLASDRGQELIWTFERFGTKVYKRVFHPGSGEKTTGADFTLYKKVSADKVGITAVQVKRNRGKPYFEFDKRDLTQRNRLATLWGSAYYLMVDETCGSPLYCFISAMEIYYLIQPTINTPPVRISNLDIRRLCRGSNLFYSSFYSCSMGSKYAPNSYLKRMETFTRRSKRIVAEIYARPQVDYQVIGK